ncbi:MAG TPA: integration host factor subunit alpha, partial [Clostridiales bacterium]|nr:integration host factor subunit alpha [Clostridiales bacterium]
GERMGRNPQTKEEIKIAAYKCATFSPSKNLKSLLNQ